MGEMLPNYFSVAFCREAGLISDLNSGRVERSNCELAIHFVWSSVCPVTIEDDAFHRARTHGFAHELIVVALIRGTLKISRESAKPADHICP